jgi:spore coat polysaccharide biosynthesis predicted glycosyltransferase SpsG
MIPSAKSLTDMHGISAQIEKPGIWLRTAAGPQIGFGHLRRSLIIARELRDCFRPLFLIDLQDIWSRDFLIQAGFDFFDGDPARLWALMPDPAVILIDTRIPDGLDRLIECARIRNVSVVSIHDLGLNPVASDVQIDGSILPLPTNSKRNGIQYSGPSYMVLDPDYREFHQEKKLIRRKIKSVFVNLGGGDSRRFFLRVLQGMKLWGHRMEVIGAPGFADWGQEELERMDWNPVIFRWESGSIGHFLFQADLAITAGGISAYEALCTGTPLMALSYDGFQQSTISGFAQAGACISLGLGDDLDPRELAVKFSDVELNVTERQRLSWRGRKMVDGLGAERVSQIIRTMIFDRLASASENIQ